MQYIVGALSGVIAAVVGFRCDKHWQAYVVMIAIIAAYYVGRNF